ncbi:unnamed protein product [Blepharisma stoltei]|uniref:Uncharacterized protein n=1 Tax=Blepharisma stoltei TaxID=1481888 RepID=A0AAU9JG10_9CILI|nr:unnamed protein product [Blepharisma stoltei]
MHKTLFILVLILGAKANTSLFQYNLYQGIGQVLEDSSGNANHCVNGWTAEIETSDSNWTPRGAYFSGVSLITPPKNSVVQNSLTFPHSFTITMWIKIISEGVILSRYDSSNNILFVFEILSPWTLNFWAWSHQESFPAVGNPGVTKAVTNDQWYYLAGVVNKSGGTTQETLYVGNTNSLASFSGHYKDDTGQGFNIGCDPTCTNGFIGFIYEINAMNDLAGSTNILSSYSTSCSGSCSGCPSLSSTCIPICDNFYMPNNCLASCNCYNGQQASCLDSDLTACLLCDSVCERTCSGPSSTDCIDIKATYCAGHPYSPIQKSCLWSVSCPTNCYYCEVNSVCLTCDPGYFVSSGNCVLCYSACATCSGLLQNECLTCSTIGITPSSINTCECTSSQYQISPSPLTCGDCDISCATCSGFGPTKCLTCADLSVNIALPPGSCSCGLSQYTISHNPLACGNCHATCKSCSGPLSTQCISCMDSSIILATIGSCSCKSNEYMVQKNPLLCETCDDLCKTCNGPTSGDCLTCKNSTFSPSAIPGFCACKANQFISQYSPLLCKNCDSSCNTCIGSGKNDCLTCKDFSIALLNPPEACSCDSSQYIAAKSPLVCMDCDISCSSCSGPGSDDCLACADSSISLFLTPNSCTCKNSQYIISKSPLICGNCDPSCASCIGSKSNQCTSCLNYNITPSSLPGECSCLKSQYIISYSPLSCGNCDSSCLTCVGPGSNQCLSCSEGSVVLSETPSACAKTSNSTNTFTQISSQSGAYGAAAVFASSFIQSLLTGRTGALWTYVNIIQMLAFIPLQNIEIPESLYEFWKSFLSYRFLTNIGEMIYGDCQMGEVKPIETWHKYGYRMSSFFINGSGMLLILLIVVSTWVFIGVLGMLPCGILKSKVREFKKKYKYTVFIRLWLEIYILLMAAAVIGINNYSFEYTTTIIDSISAYLLICCGWFFIMLWIFILHMKRFKIFRHNPKTIAKYGTLFAEFDLKNDDFIQLLYYPYFLIRRFIYVVVLYNFSSYPAVQCAVNSAHTFLIVLFLFKYWNFKDKESKFLNITGEIIVLLSFLATAVYLYKIPYTLDMVIQTTVFIVTMIYLFISYLFLFIKLYLLLKSKCTKKAKPTLPEVVISEEDHSILKTPQNHPSSKKSEGDEAPENTPIDAHEARWLHSTNNLSSDSFFQ